MTTQQDPIKALDEIRSMMSKSTRFISLSGLSGIFAGSVALLGSWIASYSLNKPFFHKRFYVVNDLNEINAFGFRHYYFLIFLALAIFVVSMLGAIYFTNRRTRKTGQSLLDETSRRMLFHLSIPLFAGLIFVLGLYRNGDVYLMAPSSLIFYGLALLNASKYTLRDIYFLGISIIICGLAGIFVPGFGLELWAFGFGVLHIVYGSLMYAKQRSN